MIFNIAFVIDRRSRIFLLAPLNFGTTMAEEKKSSPSKAESKPSASESKPKAKAGPASQNGKGDVPRNIFSEDFRQNFDSIDWGK
jgi:hypothetical protein